MTRAKMVSFGISAACVAASCIVDPGSAAAQQSVPVRPAETGRYALSLDAALAAAADANIDVVTARLAIGTARANLRSANTAPNPVLSANVVQFRPQQVGKLPYFDNSDNIVRIDVPLERGGKRRARVGAARASIDAAEGDFSNARRQMRVAVTGAYYDLKAAEAHVATLRTIADSYAAGFTTATRQQRAGALSNGDLARQKVEVLRAETEARQAVTDLQESQLALATLIGREGDAPALATIGGWPLPDGFRPEPPDELASRRPDVQAAQARVEAARRNLDGAHALRYPDITVGAQFERAEPSVGVGKSMGAGFSIPLPIRNTYRGEVDAAGVALTQAEVQARKALAVATAEIVIARRSLAETTDRRRLLDEQQLPAARKAAQVAEFAYSQGASTLLELLDARRSLQSTQLGAIDAHADEARAIARLHAAETTGGY